MIKSKKGGHFHAQNRACLPEKAGSVSRGQVGAAYFYAGVNIFGSRFVRLGSNPSMLKPDAAYVYAREQYMQIGIKNFPSIKNWNTIYYNVATTTLTNPNINGSGYWSFGINPWTRTIFHAGPGYFK